MGLPRPFTKASPLEIIGEAPAQPTLCLSFPSVGSVILLYLRPLILIISMSPRRSLILSLPLAHPTLSSFSPPLQFLLLHFSASLPGYLCSHLPSA